MPQQIVGPAIVVVINLCLAVWALATRPREAAYRVFAALALTLALWNLGGVVGWVAGLTPLSSGMDEATWSRLRGVWLRLSFIGSALVAPNMVCLVLAARGRRWAPDLRPNWWVLLLYVPAIAMGVVLDIGFVSNGAATNSWRRAFYQRSDPRSLRACTAQRC